MKKLIFLTFLFLLLPLSVSAQIVNRQEVTFSDCVDGDTAKVVLNGTIIKIRLLAVDTPETKHPTKGVEPYGKEASNYTCQALKTAHKIEIAYDENSSKKDKYDRDLVWLYIDNELFQLNLVSSGYAEVAYLYGNYEYIDQLESAQEQAQKQKIGIWSDEKTSAQTNSKLATVFIAIAIIIFIIFFITNKKFQKKTIRTIKKDVKSSIKKEIKKKMK